MYVAIRRLQVKPGFMDEAVRLVENELVPILSSSPGFVEYDVVQAGEDVGLTICVFGRQAQSEEANPRPSLWVKNHFAPLSAGPHEIGALREWLVYRGR